MVDSRFSQRSLLALVAMIFVSACSGRTATGDADSGHFYSYLDGSGNMVVVERPAESGKPGDDVESTVDGDQAGGSAATAPEEAPVAGQDVSAADEGRGAATTALAETPDELWTMPDEAYLSAEQVEVLLDQRKRDRFIAYIDETGQRRTVPLDLEAVRQAEPESADDLGEWLDGTAIETGVKQVDARCCLNVVSRAVVLDEGDELSLRFTGKRLGTVTMDGVHPAIAIKLPDADRALLLKSWDVKGYLVPQLLFLDAAGIPLAHVSVPFSRHFPETWSTKARLQGRIVPEPGTQWVVFFLDYISLYPDRVEFAPDRIRLGEKSYMLTDNGEAVVSYEADER